MTKYSLRPTLIYILGMPYSGSTLVSLGLGTANSTLNLGEIVLLENDYNNGRTSCICGKRLYDCSFWSAFVSRYRDSGERPGFDFDNRPRQRYDPIDGSSLAGTLAEVCGIAPERVYGRAAVERYRTKAVNFIRDTARLTGAQFIVDASKTPRRLKLLLDDPDVDVRVVWVAKPLRSAYASKLKRARRKNRFYTPVFAPYYVAWVLLQHLRLASTFRKVDPSRRATVAFNAFIKEPQHLTEAVSALLDAPIALAIERGTMRVGYQHVFTGSRWITAQTGPLRHVPLKQVPDPPLSLFERWSYAVFAAVFPVLRS